MDWIREAEERGRSALSEHKAKKLLEAYGIPVTREILVQGPDEAVSAAEELGYPVVLKACSDELLHKSEQGAVVLNLSGPDAVRDAYERVAAPGGPALEGVLVQEMVPGLRELALGLIRDPQFGPCVMVGMGGVMTEVLEDTAFRVAPFDRNEAEDMVRELRFSKALGSFRGQSPVDLETLGHALMALGRIGLELEAVAEIDVNPMIVTPEGRLKAADALVALRAA
jgi:succinyl-CoA synthetase beta subunit